uniref:Nucleolar protein 12 n=1 Tax=Globisporangium ultimum (strain ATCC 200006 / CBS 805.95 / DAOM BR144) TaxID=431595 RepID=K3WTL5_GLOUD
MAPKNMKRGGKKHGKKPSGGGNGGGVKKGSIGSGGTRKPNPKKKSKLVVTFDPEKRKEYLTGFHKRKQERRRFGLDMEAFKQQKQQKEKLASLNLLEPPEEQEDKKKEDSDDDEESKAVTKVMHFDDEHTQNKFGDVVTVTTSIGDLQSDSEDEISDEEYDLSDDEEDAAEGGGKRDHSKFKEKQLSLFQRIQLKRRGMALPSKRAKLKEARANRKATLGKKSHKAKAPNKKDAIEVVAAGSGKPKKGAFGKGKFSKR